MINHHTPTFLNLSPTHWLYRKREEDAQSVYECHLGLCYTTDGRLSKLNEKREYIIGGFYHEHLVYEATQNPRYPI